MKDFHAWLSDLTEDLRARQQPEPPTRKEQNIDYNFIHDMLISTIKSVAWRAETGKPMEPRIQQKIEAVKHLYDNTITAMIREVDAGLRSRASLTEFIAMTGDWMDALWKVRLNCPTGKIPDWKKSGRYQSWHIEGV